MARRRFVVVSSPRVLYPLSLSGGRYWLLGSQHLARAVQKHAEKAEAADLPLQDWMKEVYADVLAPGVDIQTRRLLSGQSNASQHMTMTTTVSECMTLLLHDTPPENERDLHSRIKRALEMAGLNVDVTQPVYKERSAVRSSLRLSFIVPHHKAMGPDRDHGDDVQGACHPGY